MCLAYVYSDVLFNFQIKLWLYTQIDFILYIQTWCLFVLKRAGFRINVLKRLPFGKFPNGLKIRKIYTYLKRLFFQTERQIFTFTYSHKRMYFVLTVSDYYTLLM